MWQLIKLAIHTFHSVNGGGAYPDLSFVGPAARNRLGPLSKPMKVGQCTLVSVRQAIDRMPSPADTLVSVASGSESSTQRVVRDSN